MKITIDICGENDFELKLRNPLWSESTTVFVNGNKVYICNGYIAINRNWKSGDIIEISFDMTTKVIRPIPYGYQILVNKPIWDYNYMITTYDKEDPKAKNHIALMRGPIMLAQDSRLGYDMSKPANIADNENKIDAHLVENSVAPYKNIVCIQVLMENGKYITLTDYASAGKLWKTDNTIAVWILNK